MYLQKCLTFEVTSSGFTLVFYVFYVKSFKKS